MRNLSCKCGAIYGAVWASMIPSQVKGLMHCAPIATPILKLPLVSSFTWSPSRENTGSSAYRYWHWSDPFHSTARPLSV